jgi:hypothetical protein
LSAARTQCSARLGARDGRPAFAGLTVPTSVLMQLALDKAEC